MIKEEWKDVNGYEGLYQISNLGKLKSFHNKKKNPKKNITKYGYIKYRLSSNGKSKGFFAHRLVSIAFIPNPKNLETVNHKDGVKTNNNVLNLEWMSKRDNIIHAYKTGLACNKKENHPMWNKKHSAKTRLKISNTRVRNKVDKCDMDFNTLETYSSYTEAAKDVGGSSGCISNCIKGKQITAYGFKWKLNDIEL